MKQDGIEGVDADVVEKIKEELTPEEFDTFKQKLANGYEFDDLIALYGLDE